MAEYTFTCKKCSKEFSHFCSMNDIQEQTAKKLIECIHCKSTDIKREYTFPKVIVGDSFGILEQVAYPQPDGSMLVEPKARNLKNGHRRIIPPPNYE